jgi:hypothetical protein
VVIAFLAFFEYLENKFNLLIREFFSSSCFPIIKNCSRFTAPELNDNRREIDAIEIELRI